MFRLVIPVFLFPFLFTGFLCAQKYSVEGVVSDSATGEPMFGVAVMAPAASAGVYSDEEGRYQLKFSSSKDTLLIEVGYTGYVKQRIPLALQGTSPINLDIVLAEQVYATEDVVITAARGFEQRQADVTVSMSVVRQDAINLQATPSIDRVITQIPGVDDLGGQINIRGSSGYARGVGSRVMLMKDGLPLLTGDAAAAELSMIPVDNVSQVEVLKGASSVLYGSGSLGGVINVISAEPTLEPVTSLRLRGALYSAPANKALDWDGPSSAYEASAHLYHSRRIGDFSLTVQGEYIKSSGYYQGTDREDIRGILLLGYRPKKVPGLSFGVNLTTRIDSGSNMEYWRSYHPKDTVLTIAPNGVIDTALKGGALTPTRDAGAYRQQLSTRIALDPYIKYLTPKGDLFWYRGRIFRNDNKNNTGQSNYNYLYYNDFMYQKPLLDHSFIWTLGATATFSGANAQIYEGGTKKGDSYGVFTQLDGKFGKLNTNLGVRLESAKIDTLARETQPVFRAGVNYELARGTNIRASFGQAFRVPSVAERYTSTAGGGAVVLPNPNLKSERGYSAEIALRQGFRSESGKGKISGYVDLAGFLQRYTNMVEFGLKDVELDLTNGIDFLANFTSTNVAEARITGAELTFGFTGEWGPWRSSLGGGVTYINPVNLNATPDSLQQDLSTFNEDLENAENLGELFDVLDQLFNEDLTDNPPVLKYRSRWTVRGSASVGYKQFDLTANFRYRSFMETIDQALYLVVDDLNYFRTQVNPNGDPTLDLIFSFKPTPKTELSLNISNISNFEYMTFIGTLAEQRKFTLQYLVRF